MSWQRANGMRLIEIQPARHRHTCGHRPCESAAVAFNPIVGDVDQASFGVASFEGEQ